MSRRRGGSTGVAVLGLVSVLFLGYEWNFRRVRVAGEVFVVAPSVAYGRSGLMIADVVHRMGGRPAGIRSWFHRFWPGEVVEVLYRPGEPGVVVPDLYWQRHFGSTGAVAMFAVGVIGEIRGAASRRRRSASFLLGDDPIEEPEAEEALRRLGVE